MIKAVRGATTVPHDSKEDINNRVIELVDTLFKENNLNSGDVVSINFTITDDLVEANPAAALRSSGGYHDIPLFCAQEPKTKGALKKAVRILVTLNYSGQSLVPIYLHGAKVLRPDLIN